MSSTINLSQLLHSEKYSDLKFICRRQGGQQQQQQQEFKVHKAIVCTQSPVLAAALNGNFQESQTNIINIDEFDAETVGRMVVFMYGEDYEDDNNNNDNDDDNDDNDNDDDDDDDDDDAAKERGLEKESGFESENAGGGIGGVVNQEKVNRSQSPEDPLPTTTTTTTTTKTTKTKTKTEILLGHVRVNAIADYYDIPRLKQLANTKIQRILEEDWTANNFSDVVNEVFSSISDKALHEIISSTAAAHIEELIEYEDFTAIMSDFAFGILRNMISVDKVKTELSTQRLRAAESRLESLETECTYERSLRERETARTDRIIENIDNCLKTLSNCRNGNCDAEFTCYIESGGTSNDPRYLLRCAGFHCRHRGY